MLSPSPSPSPNSPPYLINYDDHHHHSAIIFKATISAASLALLSLLLLLLFLLLKRYKNRNIANIDHDPDQESTPTLSILNHAHSHPLATLDAATDGFHPSLVVGAGPLSTVYSALSSSGSPIAVKRIHSHLILGNPGLVNFSPTLKSLSFITAHPNVLPILAYSEAPGERLIVTELIARSLHSCLHESDGVAAAFGWRERLKIAAGAARGLDHLHGAGIVHGRVKPSNILVDDHVQHGTNSSNNITHVARVCDYGLSFLDKDRGYYGYFDGEGREDDVYGFGLVLLEVLSGRSTVTMREAGGLMVVEWGLGLIRTGRVIEELLDKRVGRSPTEAEKRGLVRLAKVASACVVNGRRSRPSIGQVAAILTSLEMEAACGWLKFSCYCCVACFVVVLLHVVSAHQLVGAS